MPLAFFLFVFLSIYCILHLLNYAFGPRLSGTRKAAAIELAAASVYG